MANVYAKVIIYEDLKKKPSGKAENIPSGHDTTKITILPYNFGPFLPASTQGDTDTISEIRKDKSGTRRRNDTTGIVFTTTNGQTCRQL